VKTGSPPSHGRHDARGDKLASYRILAAALEELRHLPWTLDIVGDGDARHEIERLFTPLAQRIRFHGKIDSKADLKALYEAADLFVWPAVNEAYGMVLLEAQAFGCPVAAGAYGGVASVVKHGETGLLTPPGDVASFAAAVGNALNDREHLRRLGIMASRFVRQERDLDHAAERLRRALQPSWIEHELRVLIAVTHLLGAGHLTRAAALARAFARRDTRRHSYQAEALPALRIWTGSPSSSCRLCASSERTSRHCSTRGRSDR
jgi:hypothetical protein